MTDYTRLSQDQIKLIQEEKERINDNLSPFAFKNPLTSEADREIRFRDSMADMRFRSSFSVDVDKIINSIFYNRYSDKTQVFSFYHNDDITRRGTHVQLVARIARTIGSALNLNCDLIEAIALGHDVGHTPFGHAGEAHLNDLYFENSSKYFNHNVHSVRNLLEVFDANLTIPTYDGIICHNGEKEFGEYRPSPMKDQDSFMEMYHNCYSQKDYVSGLRPCTMEGCVVRISDIIAYIMKDRQDAKKLGLSIDYDKPGPLGAENYQMLEVIIENIVANSYGKPYIKMDDSIADDLSRIKTENYKRIYLTDSNEAKYDKYIYPMMDRLYYKYKSDLEHNNRDSEIFKHHIYHPVFQLAYLGEKSHDPARLNSLELIQDPDDIVMDYIASMTDDYFLQLFQHLYPQDMPKESLYISYFNN